MPVPPVATCSTPGCQLAVYVNSSGTPGKYCGKTHKAYVRIVIPITTTGHEGLDLVFVGGARRAASRVGRPKSHGGMSSARPARFL